MSLGIPALSDYHVHFRDGDMLKRVAPESARSCGRVMAMPNLTPPITTAEMATDYLNRLEQAMPGVDVRLAVKLTGGTFPGTIRRCVEDKRIIAFKMYPEGVTTHSSDGIGRDVLSDPDAGPKSGWLKGVLGELQFHNLVLCLHGEMPGQDNPFEREPDFLPFVDWVLKEFPKLRVVIEHASTRATVDFVKVRHGRGCNIAATITAHHLMLHVGHIFGCVNGDALKYSNGKLHPHNFCWPIAKMPSDRDALLGAATSGLGCFFLGSDSAPHEVATKETFCGCAGVYSAPVLAEALTQVFCANGAMDKLPGFTSQFGDKFYGLAPTGKRILLKKETWTVLEITPQPVVLPKTKRTVVARLRSAWSRLWGRSNMNDSPPKREGVVPFLAGRELHWKLTGVANTPWQFLWPDPSGAVVTSHEK